MADCAVTTVSPEKIEQIKQLSNFYRGCNCTSCDCGNIDDAMSAGYHDGYSQAIKDTLSLLGLENG